MRLCERGYLFAGLNFQKGTYDIMQCSAVGPACLQSIRRVYQSLVTAEENSFGAVAVCNSDCGDMQDAASRLWRLPHWCMFCPLTPRGSEMCCSSATGLTNSLSGGGGWTLHPLLSCVQKWRNSVLPLLWTGPSGCPPTCPRIQKQKSRRRA